MIAYDPSKPFTPWSGTHFQAPQPAVSIPVKFETLRAGINEFITSDGYRIELRLKLKSLSRLPELDRTTGMPQYATEFEVMPTISRALDDSIRPIGEQVS